VRVHQSQPKQKLSCISEHRTISKRISHAHDAVLLQRYNSNDKEMYQTTIFRIFLNAHQIGEHNAGMKVLHTKPFTHALGTTALQT